MIKCYRWFGLWSFLRIFIACKLTNQSRKSPCRNKVLYFFRLNWNLFVSCFLFVFDFTLRVINESLIKLLALTLDYKKRLVNNFIYLRSMRILSGSPGWINNGAFGSVSISLKRWPYPSFYISCGSSSSSAIRSLFRISECLSIYSTNGYFALFMSSII